MIQLGPITRSRSDIEIISEVPYFVDVNKRFERIIGKTSEIFGFAGTGVNSYGEIFSFFMAYCTVQFRDISFFLSMRIERQQFCRLS